MKVVEIFSSIDGEGKRTGLPVVFVRLHGCNLHSSYCDSQYACRGDEYVEMSVDQVVSRVLEYGLHYVTITGGEPLLHKDEVYELIRELDAHNIESNIETNGSIDLSDIPTDANCFVTMDWKCPGSGMDVKMKYSNLQYLSDKDVLKFVVGDENDLRHMYLLLGSSYLDNMLDEKVNIYVSPVFDKIETKQIVQYVLDHKLAEIHVQVQLHKVIWDPEQRSV